MSRSIIGSVAGASWRAKSYGDWHPGWTLTLALGVGQRLECDAAWRRAAETGRCGRASAGGSVPGLNGFKSFVLVGVQGGSLLAVVRWLPG
jgi:hypothetical protein